MHGFDNLWVIYCCLAQNFDRTIGFHLGQLFSPIGKTREEKKILDICLGAVAFK